MKYAKYVLLLLALMLAEASAPVVRDSPLSFMPPSEKEELVYNIRWSFINVGEATLGMERLSPSVWRAYSSARSYSFFDKFYKVRSRAEALWDVAAGRSLRFEKHSREGKRVTEELIVVSTSSGKAICRGDEWEVSPNALDSLNALHFVRTQPLIVGKDIVLDVYTRKKLWPLEVKVIKREKIKVAGRTYRTVLVEPQMREEGVFSAQGSILVWLTDDDRRIPVRMNSRVAVGSVNVELIEIR